ncbi:hypothetical protein KP77_24480 [Jeotgalibacillus alimentarius]|uniref:Uncharacterized protein n=1 Tax=Jeotgalibacillus alimentarius TaxID=135826 RepID=A0A0C2R981_9BACL|nr:hypothetical protein [Jeotgalibacillus alimentarius]KIL46880.1 hypothetical protein KP77_24480 [Jeotgalibacillus alimentarius]
MQFSIEEPYWKNKAEQLMIQLGFPESERERVSGKLFKAEPESESDCMQIILDEASHIQPEIETISPHADDQEIHEALQELPLHLKSAVALTIFHQSDQLQNMISADQYQEGLTRLSDHLDTDQSQTEKLLRFLKPTYDHKEMPESRESLPREEETPEPVPAKKQKAVKPIASAVLVIGLLSGAMFLLGDPPVADEGQGAQEADEDDADDLASEKAFTDEEIEEIETTVTEKKEQLAETLGLTESDLRFMMVVQQADSHIDYIRTMMKPDVGVSGPGIEDMKQYTDYVLDSMDPPLIALRNSYEQAGDMAGDNNLMRSDQAVASLLHAAPDFLMAYERKLNELILENNYTEEELRQNHSDLFEKISANGMEVTFQQTDEQMVTTVSYGGPEFLAETDYLHPEYQKFISMFTEMGMQMNMSANQFDADLIARADQLLETEKMLTGLFKQQELMRAELDSGDNQYGYELQVPYGMSYQFTDQLKSLSFDRSMYAGKEISENYREAWQYILNDEKFNGSNIRKIVSLNQWIAEKNDYELIEGFGDVSISPFSQYIDPLYYSNHSSATMTMPLSGYMEELYQIYVAEGFERIDFIHPQILIVFYLNALETGDYETAYSLVEGEDLPDYESFVQAASQYEYEFGRINDLIPVSSSDEGMVLTFDQSRNSINFTITESEDRYHIKFNSADIFEALASGVGG